MSDSEILFGSKRKERRSISVLLTECLFIQGVSSRMSTKANAVGVQT